MKDYTLQENKITCDFEKVIFKSFRKVRFGITSIISSDIEYNLALVRKELLLWQLLPGTNRTLFSDRSVYPIHITSTNCQINSTYEQYITNPPSVTPVIVVINNISNDNIVEIIDELSLQDSNS
jgi:hypothetical protein